ncbi:helix-turn-helix domain-containing protein [Lachnospiraceae bacterium 54-53]
MKYKKRGVYLKLYASYILMLLMPVLAGSIVYVQTLKVSRGQADRLNNSLMQIVKNECDNQVKEAVRNLNRLAFDTRVQSLSNVREKYGAADKFDMYALYTDLKNSNFTAESYKDVFVYFKNTETVVSTSGNMSLEMFYHLYYENENFLLSDIKQYLSAFHFQDIIPMTSEDGGRELLFTLTSLKSDIGEPTATIGIRMDAAVLEKRIASVKWDDQMQFLILDSEGRILNAPETGISAEEISYEELESGEEFKYRQGERDYTGLVMASDAAQWKYVLFTPEELIGQNAREIRKYCIIALSFCILAGFFSSHFLTNMNYNPLKALMELFRGQQKISAREKTAQEPVKGNEYQWLEQQVLSFFKEHDIIKHSLTANQKVLRKYYLFRLLEYPLEKVGDMGGADLWTGSLNGTHNLVLLFSIEKTGEEGQADQEAALRRFIVMNIAGEVLAEHFNAELVEIGEQVAAIVSLPGGEHKYLDSVRESAEGIRRMITDIFKFRIVILAGGIQPGPEGIQPSYLEAREAEEYISLLEADTIFYCDIKNASKKYYYPMELEGKIVNAMKAGNGPLAVEYIGQVLRVNYYENNISSQMFQCLLYDMMGTLMKGADENGCGSYFEKEDTNLKISIKKPFEEICRQFKQVVEELCREAERLKGTGDSRLCEKIEAYIRENYQDPDLNISQTGFHFGMTPAYISSVYKKQTGRSLLKFINSVRVEAARELLKQGISVVGTAQTAGFRDSRTFIRVFKEYTGITPGQMKKLLE